VVFAKHELFTESHIHVVSDVQVDCVVKPEQWVADPVGIPPVKINAAEIKTAAINIADKI